LGLVERSLVRGGEEVFLNGIELLEILINNCDEEYWENHVGRILG